MIKLLVKTILLIRELIILTQAEGVSDRILFLEAGKIIDKMKSENKNFNLTILTADTHFPGYIDKDYTLTKNLKKDINLSISCTSMYLYNLIENVKKI